MGAVEEAQQGTIGAVNRMVQNAAIALGVAMASVLMGLQEQTSMSALMLGFQHAWLFALTFIIIACISFVWLCRKKH